MSMTVQPAYCVCAAVSVVVRGQLQASALERVFDEYRINRHECENTVTFCFIILPRVYVSESGVALELYWLVRLLNHFNLYNGFSEGITNCILLLVIECSCNWLCLFWLSVTLKILIDIDIS